MTEVDNEPLYQLWVYNPMDGKVTIEHNEGVHKAYHKTHDDIRPDIMHPGRINGYAYRIKNGYRITDEDDKPVDDPYILKAVLNSIKDQKGDELPHVSK